MNQARKFSLLGVCLGALLLGNVASSWAAPRLERKTLYPTPKQVDVDAWTEQYLGGVETWIFRNETELLELQELARLSKDNQSQLSTAAVRAMSDADFLRQFMFLDLQPGQHLVQIPSELKKSLPPEFLHLVYRRLIRAERIPAISFPFSAAADQFLITQGVPPAQRQAILAAMVDLGDGLYLPLTPDLAPLLSTRLRRALIEYRAPEMSGTQGLALTLVIKPGDSLRKISLAFAPKAQAPVVERFLRIQRSKHPGEELRIPLERILTPFIREAVNGFATCAGPNCFNAALKASGINHEVPKYQNIHQLSAELSRARHSLSPGTPLEPGDILVYADPQGIPQHAVYYLGEDLVFHKSGFNALRPYVFQDKAIVEEMYFQGIPYQLYVFRDGINPRRTTKAEIYLEATGPNTGLKCEGSVMKRHLRRLYQVIR